MRVMTQSITAKIKLAVKRKRPMVKMTSDETSDTDCNKANHSPTIRFKDFVFVVFGQSEDEIPSAIANFLLLIEELGGRFQNNPIIQLV